MNQEAVVFFNRSQQMLLQLQSSINMQLLSQEQLAIALRSNEETLALFEDLEGAGGIDGARLERVRLKLRGNENGLATGDLLIGIAAGAMLQIAKQALSIGYGRRDYAPKGREVSGACIRDLIWHGRNQAMHYEETRLEPELDGKGKPVKGRDRSTWVKTFSALNEHDPQRFVMAPPFRSLAKDVVDLLGWTHDYQRLLIDMRCLLQMN